jgi:hypothetical protein
VPSGWSIVTAKDLVILETPEPDTTSRSLTVLREMRRLRLRPLERERFAVAQESVMVEW